MINKQAKLWIVLKVKAEFSRFGIPEMIGIYYNPYDWPVRRFIADWVQPEFQHQVYGYKIA